MTAGQQLVNTSKYESGSAWMLLQFPEECEGGGTDTLIPYTELMLDIQIDRMSVDMQKHTIEIEVQTKDIDAELGTKELSIDIQTKTKEIDNGCNQ